MNEETPIKKIVVIGPESTGKSTLCEQLAYHFNTLWCPEYARKYLLAHGKDYIYEDLLTIAKGQLKLEDEYMEKVRSVKYEVRGENEETRNKKQETREEEPCLRALGKENIEQETGNPKPQTPNLPAGQAGSKLLFIDTDMYVMKVWCEYVFGKCHQFILDQIAERKYDLYLLCTTDLPWVQDELREYPAEEPRKELYRIYKDIFINQETPWVEISGDHEKRLNTAIAAVERYLMRS